METEYKRDKKKQGNIISSEKLLTGALYIVTALCILGFIGQSIANMLIAH